MTAQRPTFGKKLSGTAQPRSARAPVTPPTGLSPAGMAFMERERQGAGVQPSPAMSWENKGSATVTGITSAGSGKPVWGLRIVALFIDSLIIGVPITFLFGAGIMGAAVSTGSEAGVAMGILLLAVILGIATIIYTISMEASDKQATFGKMAVGCVVTDVKGNKPTLGAVIMRNTVGRICSNLTPFYIGYLIGLFRSDRRCIHDLIAGTMVRKRSAHGNDAVRYSEVFV